MIDQKFKNLIVKAAKAILYKSSCFQKGMNDSQESLPKTNPYLNTMDISDYNNGWDTQEAAKEELGKEILEQFDEASS